MKGQNPGQKEMFLPGAWGQHSICGLLPLKRSVLMGTYREGPQILNSGSRLVHVRRGSPWEMGSWATNAQRLHQECWHISFDGCCCPNSAAARQHWAACCTVLAFGSCVFLMQLQAISMSASSQTYCWSHRFPFRQKIHYTNESGHKYLGCNILYRVC